MRTFETWFGQFRETISNYCYYVDFDKVVENAEKVRTELFILNALIGRADVENEFRAIVSKYPHVIKTIPILLAVRAQEIYASDAEGGGWYRFDRMCHSLDEYCVFMRKTGLFDLISTHLVNNLYDYVLGIESGLSSHGRKNRGGDQMENLVESYLKKAGVEYYKELNASKIKQLWNINLSNLTNTDRTEKRFDFVVHTKKCVYAIETNFYASRGSKLNETARSYKMLAVEARNISGFKFVWFTDGHGWLSARSNLRETFEVLPTMYNISELESGIAKELFV